MKTLKSIRSTRIYKNPYYDPNDRGTTVEAGYLIIYNRVIREHRHKIIELELVDGTTACIAECDWREVVLKGLYCQPRGPIE